MGGGAVVGFRGEGGGEERWERRDETMAKKSTEGMTKFCMTRDE